MSKFWSKRTHELSPYTAGEQPQDQQYIKLNTNENPYPPSPLVIAAMREVSGDAMRLYPDPNSYELKKAIAEYFSVWTDQVFVGNSSDEVLAHAFVALLKHSKPLVFPDISYSFYPSYCKLFGIDYKQAPLADDFSIDINDFSENNSADIGAIIFPNPNAPTGIALSLSEIKSILKANPDSPVVVDEAYVDFGTQTAIALVNDYPNLLVTQTFSKSRSLAGLRVGFAIGSVEMIEALERVKNSFNAYPLNSVSIAGAAAAIKDKDHFQKNCTKIIVTRDRVSTELVSLGFTVLPSKANFIFAKPPLSDSGNVESQTGAEELYLKLKKNGVLVRYFNSPRITGFLRITIGTDNEMDSFLAKLKALLK